MDRYHVTHVCPYESLLDACARSTTVRLEDLTPTRWLFVFSSWQDLPVLLAPGTLLLSMSRHNRRRTRPSHRNHTALSQTATFDLPDTEPPANSSDSSQVFSTRRKPQRSDISARHWHNRYAAWQTRERRQREEQEKLLAEQRRIFGGEPEERDEDGLCSNMMEYFIGLDFIMEPEGQNER
ncbi:MAG: hypothetical protein LQ346_001334 [Caloplaca aetnensis]|nr:MAG: hypothetical protein LQ346_001334 [Caloplaca aetnensis]